MRIIVETRRPARPQVSVVAVQASAFRYTDRLEAPRLLLQLRLGRVVVSAQELVSRLALSAIARQPEATSSRRNIALIQLEVKQPTRLGAETPSFLRVRTLAGRIFFYRSVQRLNLQLAAKMPAITAYARAISISASCRQPTPSSSASVTCTRAIMWAFAYRAYGLFVPPNNAYPTSVRGICRAILPTVRSTVLSTAWASYVSASITPRSPLVLWRLPSTAYAVRAAIGVSPQTPVARAVLPQQGLGIPIRVSVAARQPSAVVAPAGVAPAVAARMSLRAVQAAGQRLLPGIGYSSSARIAAWAVRPQIGYTSIRQAYAGVRAVVAAVRPAYLVTHPAFARASSVVVAMRARQPDVRLDLPKAIPVRAIWMSLRARQPSVFSESWKSIALQPEAITITVSTRKGRGLGFSRGDEFAYPVEVLKAPPGSKR